MIAESRHKIDTACTRCFLALDRCGKYTAAFQNEKRQIEHQPYIQEEKERRVNEAAQRLTGQAEDEYRVIQECLSDVRDAAGSMARILDIGEDFQNTLAVVRTLGKAIPKDQRVALVQPFKGQMHALSLLRAAYTEAGIAPSFYFDGLIFDTDSEVDRLDGLASRITIQAYNNPAAVFEFASALEKFARGLGVELTSSFRDTVGTSADLLNTAVRAAAGLGVAD